MWSIIYLLALAICAGNTPLARAVSIHGHTGRDTTNLTSDSDFYGLSPPVYPTRKSFRPSSGAAYTSDLTTFLVHSANNRSRRMGCSF